MPEKKEVKQAILHKALALFNLNGFVNVRLQHIADASEISVGHMAYHYKNKEA
ncbi:MAG: TetR/AcrR family transcriptional regulator, partial [Flammeovirgaceae bacterium]